MRMCVICGEKESVFNGYCRECDVKRNKQYRRDNLGVVTDENRDILFNTGKPWSREDEMYLCAFFESSSKKELAMALGRSTTSIDNRYGRLKKGGWSKKYKKQYWEE